MSTTTKILYLSFLAAAIVLGVFAGRAAAARVSRWTAFGTALVGALTFLFAAVEADTDHRYFLLSACGLGLMFSGMACAFRLRTLRSSRTTAQFSPKPAPLDPSRK